VPRRPSDRASDSCQSFSRPHLALGSGMSTQACSPSTTSSPVSPSSTLSGTSSFETEESSNYFDRQSHDRGRRLHRISSFSRREQQRRRPQKHLRSDSASSTGRATEQSVYSQATGSASEAGNRKKRERARESGTFTQCGRHSNDWLFGGFSVTGTVRSWLRDDGKN